MKKYIICSLVALMFSFNALGQERIKEIENKLEALAKEVPQLNLEVDFSVVGVSIQEFLRGIAESNNLNISIDPSLQVKVYNNFTNEKVKNILVFLCREYELDIRFTGSIMSFYKYIAPEEPKPEEKPKEANVTYNRGGDSFSCDLKNDSIESVIKKITLQTGKNVILAPDVPEGKIMHGFIHQMPFEQALDKLALTNNLVLTKTEDGFFILGDRETEDGSGGTKKSGSSSSKNKKSSSKSDDFSVTVSEKNGEKIISFSATDMAIADAIKEVSAETGNNYFLFAEPKGKTTTVVNGVTYDQFLNFLLQGSEFTYSTEEGIYLIGERKYEGLRSSKVVKLQYRSCSEIIDFIPAEIKTGVEIKEFSELNSFLLSGSTPQIVEIEAFIKEIDQVVPMVMIEVILVDIKKGKTISTGISAGLADTTTGGSLLPGLNLVLSSKSLNKFLPVNLGRVTRDFYIGLSALEDQDFANVRSMPKLATLNGHEATMTIGETRYYKLQTQNVVGSITNNTIITDQWKSVQADLSINIKPFLSGDDQVTLNIDVGISDFIGAPPENAPPPSSTRKFTSMVRVRDQEMILLGGMERVARAESGKGVPFLSRIPVLKWFFSSKTRSKEKSISYVFIKPSIIH